MDDWDTVLSDDEEEISREALRCLRAGLVQVKNHDGTTLRCPYSPSRKKQSYQYKDLLQHAEAVARGKRGPEEVGKHCALAEYLRTDLGKMASPPTQRAHKLEFMAPQEEDVKDLLLFPWSGVIYNIQTKRNEDGFQVGPSSQELKSVFKAFQPHKAQACWGPKGHMGVGVITFQRDFEGWNKAQAFEKWFIAKEHGRRDWERKRHHLGTEPYGWLARKEDYEGRDNQSIAKFFQEKGPLELKDIRMIGEEMAKIHEAHVRYLKHTVSEKNLEFQKALEEIEIAKMHSQDMTRQLEEKHRQELEEVKEKAERSTQDHMMQMRSQHILLLSSMGKLSERCKELEEREKLMQTQVDKVQVEQDKRENNLRLEMLNMQNEVQTKHQAEMMKLIEKHEKEEGQLEKWIQFKKLCLAEKHFNEFENQRLYEIRDAESFAKALEDPTLLEGNALKELKERIEFIENQKAQLEEQVVDLKEDIEANDAMIGVLSTKERMTNDELLEAKKVAIEAIRSVTHGNKNCSICVRKVGEMATEPWKIVCKEKYKDHKVGWEDMYLIKYSTWEELLRNSQFEPFKKVGTGASHEVIVDRSNEKLQELRAEFGQKVMDTAVLALEEMEKFNPSGRYPMDQIWNSREGRVATLAEAFEYLWSVIKQKQKKRKIAR